MELRKPSDYLSRVGTMSLIYGPTGGGKTILVGSMAAMHKTLFLNADGAGPQSLVKYPQWLANLDIVDINSIDDLEVCLDRLLQHEHSYRAVVLDSITNFQMAMGNEIIVAEMEKDGLAAKQGRRVYKPHDPDMLEQADWGKVLHRLWLYVTKLQYLAMSEPYLHVAVTAQLGEKLDPHDKERKSMVYFPALRGAWQTLVTQYFSLVGYLSADVYVKGQDVVFSNKLYTQPTGNFIAKTRYSLPHCISNPTFSTIISQVRGEKT